MLGRFTNRTICTIKCVENVQCTSKNIHRFITLHKQVPNEASITSAARFFTTAKVFYQGVEKLQEKREPVSNEGYLKSSITGIFLKDKATILSVNFSETEDLEYPVVWLRDNCQCQECFDTISNSRVHGPLSFRNDIIPKTVTSNSDSVSITWGDDHRSHFQKEWLCNHSFHPLHQMERLSNRHIRRIPWIAKEFTENFSNICFGYEDVINNDKTLLKWLETLATTGVTKLSGAPLERGQLNFLAKRVSYIRKTHYGEEYYIKGDSGANNVAYKPGALQMHTDMPYYQYMPGVVFLHFVIQSPGGGENILTDGLNAARQLPRHMYEILSKTIVEWTDIGFEKNHKFHSIYRAPVLCEDFSGNLERINWSQPQRDSVFNVTPQSALEWYEAFEHFWKILHDPENAALIKNVEGDVLAFDNRRILHGRTDYSDERRFLCGAFIDWDEIYSKIRVLRKDLNGN